MNDLPVKFPYDFRLLGRRLRLVSNTHVYLTLMNRFCKRCFISSVIAFYTALSIPVYATPDADSLKAMTSRAYQLLEEGRPEDAARTYREILTKYSDIDADLKSKKTLMKVYNNLSYLYLFEYHSPERAYPLLLKVRDLAKQYHQNDLLAASYGNIAKLYDLFGDTQNALKNFRASLHASMKANTEEAQSIRLMAFDDLANFAVHRELIDSIGDCISLFDKLPETNMPLSRYTKQLAHSLKLVNEGKYDKAYSLLKQAGTLIDAEIDSIRHQANHMMVLAAIADISGNKALAIEHLKNGLRLIAASPMQLADLKVRLYNSLYKILKEEGNESYARNYRLQALEVTDSLYCAKKFGNIRDIESMTHIDELNKNMELSSMTLRHQRQQIWILAISAFLILILCVGLVLRTKRLNRTHLELLKRHKESMQQREVELRILNEYREKIETLKNENREAEEKTVNSVENKNVTESKPKGESDNSESPPRKIPGNPEEHLQIIDEIKKVFATNSEIYDSSFSLNRLAEITGSKPKYISILINDFLNTTFSQLLAEARVAESCKLLLDDEVGQKLTIEAVAERVGYRSRTHFIYIFNKITGLTPSQYIKASKKSV